MSLNERKCIYGVRNMTLYKSSSSDVYMKSKTNHKLKYYAKATKMWFNNSRLLPYSALTAFKSSHIFTSIL